MNKTSFVKTFSTLVKQHGSKLVTKKVGYILCNKATNILLGFIQNIIKILDEQ